MNYGLNRFFLFDKQSMLLKKQIQKNNMETWENKA